MFQKILVVYKRTNLLQISEFIKLSVLYANNSIVSHIVIKLSYLFFIYFLIN